DSEVKTVDKLWELYFSSVGRNSVLLLNFPPNKQGLVSPIDARRADSLHLLITGTFRTNLAAGATITTLHPRGEKYKPSNMVDKSERTYYAGADGFTTDTLVVNLHNKKTFDVIMLQEVIELGQRTTGWSVD